MPSVTTALNIVFARENALVILGTLGRFETLEQLAESIVEGEDGHLVARRY